MGWFASLRRLLTFRIPIVWIGIAAALLPVGALLGAWSGIYSVAASRGHWSITTAFLEFALRSSVRTQSLGIDVPSLEGKDLAILGAGHFESGCVFCHGSPLQPDNPIVARMLPLPPSLSEAVPTWRVPELFWIVRNGLKFTGMPGWVAHERDDEVWAVVAFLKRLPDLSPEEYREMTRAAQTNETAAAENLAPCARCHGDKNAPPKSRFVPRLAGQTARYLELSLSSYAAGLRASGIMEPAVAGLDRAEIIELAKSYAGMDRREPVPSPAPASPEQMMRGRTIATEGIPGNWVPPCLACHGESANETFPRLMGQYAPYIAGQLRLWKKGLRDQTAMGAIMAPIARRLSDEQIEDIALFFETTKSADLRATEAP